MKKALLLSALFVSYNLAAQNVGIGTTTPQATLDVRGNHRMGGGNNYLSYDSISGRIEWRNSNLYVPVTQALLKHSAAADGLFYNNTSPVSGQLEYRNALGEPVFFTNFTNGNGYFKNFLGIGTATPFTNLHIEANKVNPILHRNGMVRSCFWLYISRHRKWFTRFRFCFHCIGKWGRFRRSFHRSGN